MTQNRVDLQIVRKELQMDKENPVDVLKSGFSHLHASIDFKFGFLSKEQVRNVSGFANGVSQ